MGGRRRVSTTDLHCAMYIRKQNFDDNDDNDKEEQKKGEEKKEEEKEDERYERNNGRNRKGTFDSATIVR